jgi:osmotically inducible protein OsmC
METMYSAHVHSSGGRAGHVKSSDGFLDLDVAPPKELGGPGGKTNPEQLFAAGYAACFENALIHVGRTQKLRITSSAVDATVNLLKNAEGGFTLGVQLEISLPDLDEASANALIETAHKTCPYSNATRGNIEVELRLVKHA